MALARWEGVENRWPERLELVASLIEPGSSVADLGAGAQGLRQFLPDGCQYHPFDLPTFDMNEDLWPTGHYDAAVMAGVFEYAHHPSRVFARLRSIARTAIVTYAHAERRRDPDWSGLSELQFAVGARRAGWVLYKAATYQAFGVRPQAVWVLL